MRPRRRVLILIIVGLLLSSCSDRAPGPTIEHPTARPVAGIFESDDLGAFAASGPVGPGQAFWSGVPVPKLLSGSSYVIESIEPRSIRSSDARVRVGVTPASLLGATQEPPDAYDFAQLPYSVLEDDQSSYLSVAIELRGEESAGVVGLTVDVTLNDGKKVRMVLPVAVVACSPSVSNTSEQCADVSSALYDEMDDEPDIWGVFDR